MIRRASRQPAAMRRRGQAWVFELPADAALVTARQVKGLLPAHRWVPLDFWFDEVQRRRTGGLVGHRQVSDAGLPTAAMRSGAKLLTFDTGVRPLLATDEERALHVEMPGEV